MSKVRTTAIALAAVATGLLGTAPAAHADESGTSGGITVTARGSGGHVTNTYVTVSSLSPFLSFTGFYKVYGPDYSSVSPTKEWGTSRIWNVQVGRDYAAGQQHCAEAWAERDGGRFELIGRPCVENPI
ncbi:hypothetical protein ACFWN2_27540 [Lentzea sp. NPDC058436]|uniref:hypothetical protein n=1 Tax=Lentzea sp. NPDC058436 TaxID=3346499 RepID=UPI003667100C